MLRYYQYPDAWTRTTALTMLLLPLSWLFRAAVALRRRLYAAGVWRATRLAVPVVVVGNITVGGTGKTPLVAWLAKKLRDAGHAPGIVSRGYGAHTTGPRQVEAGGDAAHSGDEPLLLARHTGCPVWIGADRAAAARALLAAHPRCDVILSDDGLQHYSLARDVEVAVVDSMRGLGNGRLLPAGPLREPPARLRDVAAVVVRQAAGPAARHAAVQFTLTLQPVGLRNLRDAARRAQAADFAGKRVHALAGIGNPQQFFDTLTNMGIAHVPHAFPDHHAYRAADLRFDGCDAIVMTEKDAVKCGRFAGDNCWVLEVEARVDDALMQLVLAKIKR